MDRNEREEIYQMRSEISKLKTEIAELKHQDSLLKKEIIVNVRWHDGYLEVFNATEVRFGSDLLWMRLNDGTNRNIPLRSVRWFSQSEESHEVKI